MHITWNGQRFQEPKESNTFQSPPRKHSKLYKRVRFTSSTVSHSQHSPAGSSTQTLYPSASSPSSPQLITPKSALSPTKSRRHPSFFSRFHTLSINKPGRKSTSTIPTTFEQPPSPLESEQSWHHHESYFPEYTPIYPNMMLSTQVTEHSLDPAEAQAAVHAERVGHPVVIHYPMLPRFAEYGVEKSAGGGSAGGGGKGGSGGKGPSNGNGANQWRSGLWGLEGWTGYGWEGQSFADPMPTGVPSPQWVINAPAQGGCGPSDQPGVSGGKRKKKKKKGKGGRGGGPHADAEDGDEDRENEGEEDGDDGAGEGEEGLE